MTKRKMSTYERLRKGERLKHWEQKDLEREFAKEDPGWEVVHQNVAAVDSGNGSHFVGIDPRRADQPVREFGAWTAALREMGEWMKLHGVKRVVMQSTGVYSLPLYDELTAQGFEVVIVDARSTKSLPGRKSDVQECQWIRKLDIYGLLRPCYQAPESIREIRTIWRLRQRWVESAGESIQQMQKALTKMNVQIANAISDISGKTGMAILRAIVAGERDPKVLAKLRDKRIRASEEEVAHSMEGHWREAELFELRQVLEGYDFQQKKIAECDQEAERLMSQQPAREMKGAAGAAKASAEGSPEASTQAAEKRLSRQQRRAGERKATKATRTRRKNEPAFDLAGHLKRLIGVDLTRIDGIGAATAQVIYTEIGPDFSAFRSENAFASWLGLSPKKDVSGGRVIKQYSTHVVNRVANALRMSAEALHHSDSYLGARYRQLKRQLKYPVKAVKAMARHLACLVYRMVTRGEEYVDRGAAHYEQKRQSRDITGLQKKAAAMGMKLVPVN